MQFDAVTRRFTVELRAVHSLAAISRASIHSGSQRLCTTSRFLTVREGHGIQLAASARCREDPSASKLTDFNDSNVELNAPADGVGRRNADAARAASESLAQGLI